MIASTYARTLRLLPPHITPCFLAKQGFCCLLFYSLTFSWTLFALFPSHIARDRQEFIFKHFNPYSIHSTHVFVIKIRENPAFVPISNRLMKFSKLLAEFELPNHQLNNTYEDDHHAPDFLRYKVSIQKKHKCFSLD